MGKALDRVGDLAWSYPMIQFMTWYGIQSRDNSRHPDVDQL